jgi:steroid delta-isomerase-like uncharacterized protein
MRFQISFKPFSAYSQAMAFAREQQRNKQVIRQYFEAYAVRFAAHEREKILLMTQSRIDFTLATTNDNLLKQIIEAENSHDIERLLALVTDDVVIEDVPFVPLGMVMKGKDGVRQGYSGFIQATPDFKIEPNSCVTSDRFFASEWVLTATQKGDLPGIPVSGKHFYIRWCSFGEFEDGKLKGRRDYWDYAALAKQQLAGEQK